MNWLYVVAGVSALGLLVYLGYVLLQAEKF